MRLSASLEMVSNRESDLLDGITLMRKHGFVYQDFDSCTYCGDRAVPGTTALTRDEWQKWIDAIGERAAVEGVTFTQCHGPMYNYFLQGELTEIHHLSTKRVLNACGRLGIPRIVFHPEVPPGRREMQEVDACRKVNIAFFQKLAEEAGKWDLEICIENMLTGRNKDGGIFWRYCSNPDELIDLVDLIHRENVAVCMDVGHAHFMGETLSDSMKKYGPRLHALHIHDNDGYSDQHLIPYHGTVDWEDVMTGLKRIGYRGDFTLEVPNVSIRMPMPLRGVGIAAAYRVSDFLLRQHSSKE